MVPSAHAVPCFDISAHPGVRACASALAPLLGARLLAVAATSCTMAPNYYPRKRDASRIRACRRRRPIPSTASTSRK